MTRTLAAVLVLLACAVPCAWAQAHANPVIDLWMAGKPAFGVFAPNERADGPQSSPQALNPSTSSGLPRAESRGKPSGSAVRPVYTAEGAEEVAMNPLYDFVFLNLEGAYDAEAVRAYARGFRSPKAAGRKMLIVRIPPIDRDGPDAARARVREVLEAGADGVTFPHIMGIDDARMAVGFFADAKANVWSPTNPKGETLAMLMLEDPKAVEQAAQIASLRSFSILACGIGSLTQALGGDRAGAEAGTQTILAETRRAGLVNMLTANAQDVEKRVTEGFLALLMQGPTADEAIRLGRAAAGR